MKKLGIYLLFVTLCVVTTTARAQWTDMEWETYGLGFKAPSNFDLKQNDDKAFTAKGAIFTMSIKPWEDATITEPMKICRKALNRTPLIKTLEFGGKSCWLSDMKTEHPVPQLQTMFE